MKKTVGIVTYHKSLSYGGCLQAYATMKIVEKLGYKSFFIDYENSYEARAKTTDAIFVGSPKQRFAALVKQSLFRQMDFQKKAFGSFTKSLAISDRSYSSREDLSDVSVDTLLVGSDQVWSPLITGGIDPVFYLQFGTANRRVSFASSMGSYVMSEVELATIGEYLSHFSAVSVREDFARKQIQPFIDTPVHLAADPTLQMTREEWQRIAKMPEGFHAGSFILLFMVSNSPSKYRFLLRDAKQILGLPVVQVRLNSLKPNYVDAVIPATPFELIWLIDNAAFVLTDSFHGLAFSINMETPFTLLPNKRNNVRLQELVDETGLSCRMRNSRQPSGVNETVAFSIARNWLRQRREDDIEWLRTALSGD